MVARNIEQVLADCAPTYRARHRVQLQSGELRWLWKIGGVVVDEGGKSLRLQGIALDITHEVQLEQALAFSAETLGMYAPGEGYCILRTWPDRPEVPAEVLVGSLEKVAGLHFSASRSTPGSRWKPVGDPRDPGEDVRCHEQMYRVLRDDGQIGWIRERSVLVSPTDGVPYLLHSLTDITHEKQQELERTALHKREALARLAGGVAHDLNNLMTLLQVGLFELETLSPDATPEPETLEMMRQALLRARGLTRSLGAISTHHIPPEEGVDLRGVLLAEVPQLRTLLGQDIQLSLDVPDAPALCMISAMDFRLILAGLATNAREAMAAGGTFSVRLARAASPAMLQAGEYWLLEVIDTGRGMDPDTLERAFDPYFTTKMPGAGVGLGLTTLQGLLRSIGGRVEAWSTVGIGSRFLLWFPVRRVMPMPTAAAARTSPPRGPRAAILLIEDEVLLREAAARILREQGYTVTAFSSAEPALGLPDAQLAQFSLLLSDIQLPGLDGAQAAQRLCQRHLDLRVLLTSGHVFDARAGEIAADFSFLPKPYTPDRLIAAVQRLLLDEARTA